MVSNTRQTQQRNSLIKATYVTSPPLVLAYALAGNVLTDFDQEIFDIGNRKISIEDIWPNRQEIEEIEDELIIKKILNLFNEKIQVNKRNIIFISKKNFFLILDWYATMEFIKNTSS
jgi:aconitate hydratase